MSQFYGLKPQGSRRRRRDWSHPLAADLNNDEDDEKSTSTGSGSNFTPPTNTTMPDDPLRSRNYQVPWPGNTYIIIENGTDRAITLTTASLCLQDVKEDPGANNRWQCVDSENYISFYNPKARVYMGHDGGDGVRASAVALKRWEQMVPRHHPEDGYQLLTPYWSTAMMMITAEEDGARVMRTRHGTTVWQFVPV